MSNIIVNILTITVEKDVHVLHRMLSIQCACIEVEIKEELTLTTCV